MRLGFYSALFLVTPVALVAQTGPVSARTGLDFNATPRAPVPTDPLELVTGAAQPTEDASQRISALALLNQAHDLSNVRAQPYDLKTSFSASGGLASDGNWNLEDAARGRAYRWTAQGPNYSTVNLYPNSVTNGLYGTSSGTLPLRLLQVRSALFFVHPNVGTHASVRTATGSLNGAEQRCVLIAIGAGDRSFTGGRNWEESEYCVDSQSGLLTVYSPVPGLYVRYDYSSGIRFHDKFVPTGFTISEAGQTVVEARTLSVADPPPSTDPIFSPQGLTMLGAGRAMNPGFNVPILMSAPGRPFPNSAANASIQVVTLHGNVAGDGRLSEVEVLATSDATLNQAALERAETIGKRSAQGQPGSTAQSSELILTFEFIR